MERRALARGGLVVAFLFALLALGDWIVHQLDDGQPVRAAPSEKPIVSEIVVLPDAASIPYRVEHLEKDLGKLQDEDKAIRADVKEIREGHMRITYLLIGNLLAAVATLGNTLLRRSRRGENGT